MEVSSSTRLPTSSPLVSLIASLLTVASKGSFKATAEGLSTCLGEASVEEEDDDEAFDGLGGGGGAAAATTVAAVVSTAAAFGVEAVTGSVELSSSVAAFM